MPALGSNRPKEVKGQREENPSRLVEANYL